MPPRDARSGTTLGGDFIGTDVINHQRVQLPPTVIVRAVFALIYFILSTPAALLHIIPDVSPGHASFQFVLCSIPRNQRTRVCARYINGSSRFAR